MNDLNHIEPFVLFVGIDGHITTISEIFAEC